MTGIACIVSATDFSHAADLAVRRAASLTSSLGGVLHVVHVLPPRQLLAQFLPPPWEHEIAALRKRADQALQDRVHLIAASFAVSPSWALFHGHAHRAILSIARHVAFLAPMDVLIVPPEIASPTAKESGAASTKS